MLLLHRSRIEMIAPNPSRSLLSVAVPEAREVIRAMYPEFWLKNWSMPSTDSAVKLQELVRLGYEHAVARAEASARMARSLSACRTPFDAIAVYQDWIVSESQRIVADMRRMAELSKALLESSGQALNAPMQSPMHAVADAMLRTDPEESAETGKDKPEPQKAEAPKTEASAKQAPAAQPAATAAEPKPAQPAPATPASEPQAAGSPAAASETQGEAGPADEKSAGSAGGEETAGESEESKARRKRKTAAAE
ncbi:MAG: hypothetical protein GVY13_06450 [Alphaproteobacteria bacterium]|jgi:hypothetical protein|nr:hypothetical protein [Alphaproteobacteria bacterium]